MTNLQRLRAVARDPQLTFDFMAPKPRTIGLIACSAGKLDHAAPARELYTGPIFRLARAWMERRSAGLEGWAILSAKHGLVMPDQVVEPYDLSLDSLSDDERRDWARRTRCQIIARWGSDRPFVVLAGSAYVAATDGLEARTDVLRSWAEWRRLEGLKPHHCSIGIMRKYLINDCSPGAGCR